MNTDFERASGHRRRLSALILVLSVAAAARLAALAVPAEPLPDTGTYTRLAAGLLERGEFLEAGGDRARVVPGYPLFLASCRAVFGGSDLAWRVPQALLGVATVLAVYLLGRRLFGARAGLAAAGLMAIDPFTVGFGAQMLTEGLALFLLAVAALLAWRSRQGGGGERGGAGEDEQTRRSGSPLLWAAAAGLLAGLGMLTRPAVGFIAVLLIIGALLLPGTDRPRLRSALARAALALAVCLAVLSPWWVRNWRTLGEFVPLSTDGGSALYEGNSPRATGGPAVPETVGVRMQGSAPLGEIERDRLLRSEARAWIAEHPGQFAKLAAIKLGRTWSPLPNFDAYRHWRYILPSLLAWATVMVLAGVGVRALGVRFRVSGVSRTSAAEALLKPDTRNLTPAVWFCILPVIFVAVAHMIWIGSVRYRMPAWPFLEVLAGAGAAWLCKRVSHRCTPMNTDECGGATTKDTDQPPMHADSRR